MNIQVSTILSFRSRKILSRTFWIFRYWHKFKKVQVKS